MTVAPANVQFDYGSAIPQNGSTATEDMIGNVSALGNFTKAQIASALTFSCSDPNLTENAPAGNYVYDLTIKENYNEIEGLEDLVLTVTGGSGQLKIVPKTLTADMIGDIATQTYNGQTKQPTPTVSYLADPEDETSTVTLTAGTHFTFSYGGTIGDVEYDNVNAGNATAVVKITAVDGSNYQGTAYKVFSIEKLALTSVTVATIADQTYAYGAPIEPALTVTGKDANNNQFTLTADDYAAEWENNTAVTEGGATGTLSDTDGGNFTFDDEDIAFTIVPKNINSADVTFAAIDDQTYAGVAAEPDATVNWTIGANANNITEFLTFEYANNEVVGVATITAKVNTTVEGATNYTGTKSSTFNILPASIANVEFDFGDAEIAYNGAAQTPNFTVTLGEEDNQITLEKDVDYEIVKWEDNTNASTEEVKAKVTIKGIGNFDAVNLDGDPIEAVGEFSIAKRTLTFTATAIETNFGISPKEKFASTNNIVGSEDLGGTVTYVLTKHVAEQDDAVVDEDNYGALEITTDDVTYTYVPVWTALPDDSDDEDAVEGVDYASDAQKAARLNYDLENIGYTEAVLTVNAAVLKIVPDAKTKKYGAQDPLFTFKVYNGVVDVTEDIEFTEDHEPVLVRAEGENVADGPFKISVQNQEGEGAVAADGYTFTFETANLTITPFNITVTANAQSILYGNTPNLDADFDSMVKTVVDGEEVDGNKVTVTFSPAMTGTGLITRAELNLSLDLDEDYDGTVGPHEGALIPAINNANFNATIVPGDLTVVAGNILILGRTNATCKDQIVAFDDEENVTVKFESRELAAETWQAMAFPFDITVAELSNAVYTASGAYAVVNILNEETPAGGKPAFKLWMREIPANTPFLFKIYNGTTDETLNTFDMEDLIFTNKTIDYVEKAESHDLAGNYFYGIYETTEVTNDNLTWLFNHNNGKFVKYTGTKRNLNPLTGYLHTADNIDAFARITVEELDGSTTAISSISADGVAVEADGWYTLDGIKLNVAPTQKGVYIQNGKKVVLK